MRLVYPRIESSPDDASEKLLKHAARRRMQIAPEIAKANFVIHADTPYYASLRRFFLQSKKVGEAEARARLNELLEALKKYDLLKNEQISGSGTASTNTQAVVY